MQQETKIGALFAVIAFTFWGLAPVYFKSLAHIPPPEILLHRVLWSVIFLFFILAFKRQFQTVKSLFHNRIVLAKLLFSSLLVGGNWLIYIWAVNNDRLIEASLGYYINPLVNILLGYLFLQERSSFLQKVAISLAFIAVSYQIYMLNEIPLVSLSLAFSFGFYGLLRKKIAVSSLPGLYIETVLLLPLALVYLLFLITHDLNHFALGININTSLLLILAGPVTIFPLLCFNSAATRLRLSTMGFFQYIAPSVSLLLAVFLYHEPLTQEKLITFSLIWSALILVSLESFFKRKAKDT